MNDEKSENESAEDDTFDGFPADVPPEIDEQADEIAAIVAERVSKVLTQRRDRIVCDLSAIIRAAIAENLIPPEIAYRVVRRLEVVHGFAPVVPGEPSAEERAAMQQPVDSFISHEVILQQFLDRAKVEHDALHAKIQRLREGREVQADAAVSREVRLMEDVGALATAIANAAHRAGIYNGEVALTGPDLILLAQNMAEEIERSSALRTRDARIPSLDELDALLTKCRAQSHGEPIDLLSAIDTAEARAEAAREHLDPNARRFLLLDCAAWALAAVCEIDGTQASAPVVVAREANDVGGGP